MNKGDRHMDKVALALKQIQAVLVVEVDKTDMDREGRDT